MWSTLSNETHLSEPVMPRMVHGIVSWSLVGFLCWSGCADHAPKPAENPPPRTQEHSAAPKPLQDGEFWEIAFLQGTRIGYGRMTIEHATEADRNVVRFEKTDHLTFKRAGQVTRQEMRTQSVETPQGRLISFESDVRIGPSPLHISGQVQGDKLDLHVQGPGASATQSTTMPWASNFWGPFGTEQTLLREPMRPGQQRSLKMLMCGLDAVEVVDVELAAQQFETVALPGGARELLRIATVLRLSTGQKIEGALWTDASGNMLKQTAAGLEVYRVPKSEALAKPKTPDVDLLSSMSVKVAQPLPQAHQLKEVRYRVHWEGGDPSQVFAAGPTQSVKSLDPHTAEINVYAIRPGQADGNRSAPPETPTKEDRESNRFLQSDDPQIIALAQKAVGEEKDPWRRAVALERFVHREVKNKDFSQGFATAAEVAQSREGDCTEHAVLLAAMARTLGIPARVAIGLVYLESQQQFFYHMWTEMFLDGRWVPLDGTLALGGIGAGHLKITNSTLSGASAHTAFLPVLEIAGKLKIDVLDAK